MSNKKSEQLEQLALAHYYRYQLLAEKHPRLHFAREHHLNIRGEPMSFEDKPYLLEIYLDIAPEIILQSSVQTGKSEFLIVSAHSWAERGLQVLYVLPTIDLRNSFVANRVDKLYERIPYYSSNIQSQDSRGLKHFGSKGGAIFFAGSNSSTTFIEKPIDCVIGDETDRFDQTNYEKADDRMTASPYKLKYEASNPTVGKYGINKRYLESDQREWFVKCPCCNYWQEMDWFKNVVRQTDDGNYALLDKDWHFGDERDIHMLCIRCGRPLNRFTKQACWVSRFPKLKNTHGYHIHQMLSSYVRIDKMWDKYQKGLGDDTVMQVFWNSMLGLPYAGKGSKLTDEILNACKEGYNMPVTCKGSCFMGVDVGKVLNVIVAEERGGFLWPVFIGTVREFEDLDALMKRFNILTYVIDSMPEARKTMEYVKRYIGRGWASRYQITLNEITANEADRVLSADRTMIMDRVMKFFTDRRFKLPRNAHSIDSGQFYEQMKNPTRIYDAEKGRFEWLGTTDHYFHAAVYLLMAYLARGNPGVVGLQSGAPEYAQKVPETFEAAMPMPFPPGTPQSVIDHYNRLYEQAKANSKIKAE